MGFLFRRKRGGSWFAGFKNHASGRWVQRSTNTTDRKAAQLRLAELERQAAAGQHPTGFAAFAGEVAGRRGHGRLEFTVRALTDPHSPLASLTLDQVDVAAITRYISWRLGHGRNRATVGKELAFVKSILDEAAEMNLLPWASAYAVRRKRWAELRSNPPRERVLLPAEIELLLDAARGNANLQDAITVALFTGLRSSNVLHLTEHQVDFGTDPAVIRFSSAEMKGQRGHLVRLAPRARDVLWRRWTGNPSRRFFQDFRPTLKRLLSKLERDGKLVGFTFHDLRRTYASYRIAAGADVKTVQGELAHRSSRMTLDVYARPVDPAVRGWARLHFNWDSTPAPQAGEISGREAGEANRIGQIGSDAGDPTP